MTEITAVLTALSTFVDAAIVVGVTIVGFIVGRSALRKLAK